MSLRYGLSRKFSRILGNGRKGTIRGRGKRVQNGCMEPTERHARAGASVVGGKREFALSHPRIYPTSSSQGAGLRYHPCYSVPRPSVFSPAFFSPIGRPSRQPAMRRSQTGLAWAFVFDASRSTCSVAARFLLECSNRSRFNWEETRTRVVNRCPSRREGKSLFIKLYIVSLLASLRSLRETYISIIVMNDAASIGIIRTIRTIMSAIARLIELGYLPAKLLSKDIRWMTTLFKTVQNLAKLQ